MKDEYVLIELSNSYRPTHLTNMLKVLNLGAEMIQNFTNANIWRDFFFPPPPRLFLFKKASQIKAI